jgi:stearoyl-CoA desaturase (delta-9 desaturase)
MYSRYPEGYKPLDYNEKELFRKFDSTQDLPWPQYLYHNVRPVMATYIIGVHILGMFAVPCIFNCKAETILGLWIMYIFSGFGITAGAHRLWTHKSYKATSLYRWVVMFFNSIANQGGILNWTMDHRVHHKYSETRADPHNALRGFFFAQIGWLCLRKDPRVKCAGKHIPIDDLKALPEVMFQKRMDPFLSQFCCFVLPIFVGNFWGETYYNSFMILGVFRYICVLNASGLVNSVAHMYGTHPYDPASNPAESPAVSLISLGEGWHNYHHAFPSDYATSEFGWHEQWNPTRLFIDACACIGLVSDRKRSDDICTSRLEKKNTKIEEVFLFRHRS